RRPRRCGWFDAMAVRYSADLCGATHIAITLLDVLGTLPELKICTGYTVNGKPAEYFRADADFLSAATPVYETLPGWTEDISACRTFDELPANAKRYVTRLEQLLEVPVKIVSVGADRAATIMR
ncbi:MAG TPA: adenylosuccinate synthetase, partial [Tepidisphaeraceae bacterium]|nr:adenylosuccinate synthetase [Tepidisphaeraceae bacterium]